MLKPPFIQFPIDLTRLADILGDIHKELAGIHVALDRLAPAIPDFGPSQPAGLSDLRHTDPSSVAKVKRELELFAQNSDTVVDSDAFVQSIIEYERQIVEAYGEEAINDLPWNKALGRSGNRASGGSLFSEARKSGRDAEGQRVKERAQDHCAQVSQTATESKADKAD